MQEIARDVYEAMQQTRPAEARVWQEWIENGEARIVDPERGRVTQESPGTFYGGPGYVTVWYEDGPECPICGRPRVWRETDAGLICGTGEDCGRRMDPVDPCWSCRETLDRIGRR